MWQIACIAFHALCGKYFFIDLSTFWEGKKINGGTVQKGYTLHLPTISFEKNLYLNRLIDK